MLEFPGDVTVVVFYFNRVDTDIRVDWFRGCVGDEELIREEIATKYITEYPNIGDEPGFDPVEDVTIVKMYHID